MINNTNTNLLNTNINRHAAAYTKSENKYYNIFSKKLEKFNIPNLDLEFNAVLIPEKSTFMRTA